ncbi:hypothetical protein CRG98_021428, partial [Punica granatum]
MISGDSLSHACPSRVPTGRWTLPSRAIQKRACGPRREFTFRSVQWRLDILDFEVWWENLKRRREREGKRRIVTWEKMKRELKKKFLPASYKQDIFSRLYNFKQEELTVEEYTAEFEHLMMKCDIVEPEEQIIARYLSGLRSEIRNVCRGFGHIASECPNRKIISLVEETNDEPVYDTYDDEENEVEQEEVTYGDQGKALVVLRILKSAHVEDDKWLRHNIFHTRCTSHGK